MATKPLLKLRLGVADDPTAMQPRLSDCLEAVVQQAEALMGEVIEGLTLGAAPMGPRKIPAFQKAEVKAAVAGLAGQRNEACATFRTELSRVMYEGGGKDQTSAETLRFEDLQLFEDAELDQSIEVARAQQEASIAVDDVLPTLDSLISTMLGWRTIQPGLNPVRPELFVRALQATLATHVPAAAMREQLIAPAGGMLGANLRTVYRELSDWLLSTGVEPARPLRPKGGGPPATDPVAKTMLTLERLRKLLVGDFDSGKPKADFQYTMPASMGMLQELRQTDALIKKLENRVPLAAAPTGPLLDNVDPAKQGEAAAPAAAPAVPSSQAPVDAAHDAATQKLGQQLGSEVIRLMFDNLTQDRRLLPEFKVHLKTMEKAVLKLSEADSRFFSDRNHPARQFLDRITQRSLAFTSTHDEGWRRFLVTIEQSLLWLESKVIDADTFGELMEHLNTQWDDQDKGLRARREEAARNLLHAEQRNLLAQKLATEFAHMVQGLEVAQFVTDFLKGSWSQVVAEAQLSCTDGSTDPFGYRAVVDDLVWSVQKSTSKRGRSQRLQQMVPALTVKLQEGLHSIQYPPELAERFFKGLATVHQAAVLEDQEVQAKAAAAELKAAQLQAKVDASAANPAPAPAPAPAPMQAPAQVRTDAKVVDMQAARADAKASEAQAKVDARVREAQARTDANKALEAQTKIDAKAAQEQARADARAAEAQIRANAKARAEAQAEAQAKADAQALAATAAAAKAKAEAEKVEAEPSQFEESLGDPNMWIAGVEVQESGWVDENSVLPGEWDFTGGKEGAPAPQPERVEEVAQELVLDELRTGNWVELMIDKQWTRVQLTWASPHATLFMFTSPSGTAHSMSRRTLEKARVAGNIRVIATRNVVDEALDQVAQQALKNSLGGKG